jgi:omega-amidase
MLYRGRKSVKTFLEDLMKWKIAVIQMDLAFGNPEANFAKAKERIAEAAGQGADVIVLPELWTTGYDLNRLDEIADPEGRETSSLISELARKHSVHIVAGSVAARTGEGVANTLLVFDKHGNLAGRYGKAHLFRLMDEEKHLVAGNTAGLFRLDGVSCAGVICYDIRFPELARKLALGGAKILFVPAEWPHPRLHHWRTLLQARAIENQMFVVSCNTVGDSGGTSFFGHSMIIDPWGEVIAEAGDEETILAAEVDLSLADEVRGRIPVFADRRPETYE